jgi:hypothetical protein
MKKFVASRFIVGTLASCFAINLACAQTPGEWKYAITTDPQSVPEEMRVNFPTVSFSVCRTAEEFESARAFSIQTLASSDARCKVSNIVRTEGNANQAAKIRFDYACDEGTTLSGSGEALIEAKRFVVSLESKYAPPVSGVERVKQTMRAQHIGACKKKPDADVLKTE